MMKIILRTLIILLVTGLVAGGIYLLVEKTGVVLGGSERLFDERSGDFAQGHRFSEGTRPERPEGLAFEKGEFERRDGDHEGENGFSWMGLGGVVMQAGKIALITAVVVAFQALFRLFKRRSRPAAL